MYLVCGKVQSSQKTFNIAVKIGNFRLFRQSSKCKLKRITGYISPCLTPFAKLHISDGMALFLQYY